eukprot:513507-Amphidinium_carterae.1
MMTKFNCIERLYLLEAVETVLKGPNDTKGLSFGLLVRTTNAGMTQGKGVSNYFCFANPFTSPRDCCAHVGLLLQFETEEELYCN